jgi:hypothetical protein
MKRPFASSRPIGPLLGEGSISMRKAISPRGEGSTQMGKKDTQDKPASLDTYTPTFDDSKLFP